MKELSIEQKAQRYDEALTKARNIVNSINVGLIGKDSFEAVFPELEESEDERIRKNLIGYIKGISKNEVCEETKDSWIAWLEKQGGQPKKVSIWKHWKDGIAGTGEGEPIYLIKDGYTYSISSCLCFECDYIELSELDKLLSEKQGGKKTNPVLDIEIPFGAKDSELQEATYHIPKGFHAEIDDDKVVVKQGEQKPAWSEEDEIYRNYALSACIHYGESKGYVDTETHQNVLRWLTTLSPQNRWKPTEEQMLAIKTAINVIGKDTLNGKQLIELQEQLKKLKGE